MRELAQGIPKASPKYLILILIQTINKQFFWNLSHKNIILYI